MYKRVLNKLLSSYKRTLAHARFDAPALVYWLFEHQINPNDVSFSKSSREVTFLKNKMVILFPEHGFVAFELARLTDLLNNSCTLETRTDGILKLKWKDVEFQLKTSEEIFIAYEILVEDTYNIRLKENTLVLDVGMNVGFTSIYFCQMAEVDAVIGYEPFPETIARAHENISGNTKYQGKHQSRGYGLGAKYEILDVQYCPEQKGSMSIHGIQPWVNPKLESRLARIEVRNVEDEWQFLKTERRNIFVKLDCEGAEYEIIEKLVRCDLIKYIYGFVIEWHHQGDAALLASLHQEGFISHSQRHPRGHRGLIYAFRTSGGLQ